MRIPLRLSLLILALLIVSLLSGGKEAKAQAHSAPLELLGSGHIAIQVHINGQGPFRMILDTGSPVTLISTSVARELKVLPPQQNSPALGGLGFGGMIVLKSLAVGDTEIKGMNTIIMDHPTVEALGGVFGRLDGIVGFPFYARFHTTIDYLNARVSFEPVNYQPENILSGVMSLLMGGPQKARVIAPRSLWGLAVAATPQNNGVVVNTVYPKSPAAQAGFQPGDHITILDDRWTDTVNDLYEAASRTIPDQPVVVKILRGEKEILLTVRPRPGI